MDTNSPREAPAALYQEALATFTALLDEARASGDTEPTAMTLATADAGGRISARIVLLKAVDADGFRFFTNYESLKGAQLAAHPQAALCFHWKLLREQVQVRVEGDVSTCCRRPNPMRISRRVRAAARSARGLRCSRRPCRIARRSSGASPSSRSASKVRVVPRPPHWGGYLVRPDRIEFWYGAQFRLHERVAYVREGGVWRKGMLYP